MSATEAPASQSGAEILLRALKDQGVEVIFGYPGGAVLPIYDALFNQNAIRHILVRQEGGAVHAAEGYARSTGKVGVVLVTSGPGATNAVTGLVDALMDSIPIVCLTGQVPTHLIGNDAFQEADTTGITRPATKHNYLVKNAEDLARVVHEAFYVARSGRPGPVVIDLPKDIVIGKAPYAEPATTHRSYRPRTEPDPGQIAKAIALLKQAKRPMIYAGGGVINAGPQASALLTKLVRTTGFPVTNTLMGLGAFPASDPRFLGMLGMHGTYEANLAMHGCDVHAGDRRAVRRPGDRAAERVQPGLAEDPHRHRSVLDQQERSGGGADRRRCRRGAGGAAGRLARRPDAGRQPGADRVVAADRRLAGEGQPEVHPGHEARVDHQAAIRDPAAVRDHARHASRTSSSPPRSASTRCGPRSTSSSSSRTTG